MQLLRNTKKNVAKLVVLVVFATFLPLTAMAQTTEPPKPTPPPQAVTPAPVPMVPLSFTDIAEQVSPVVVNVKTLKTVEYNNSYGGFGNLFGNDDALNDMFEQFFGQNPFGGPGTGESRSVPSLGSGFIWDAEGHVVTNYHVVEDVDEITVTIGDDEYVAELIGSDPNTDLALLKIEKPDGVTLPSAVLGDSEAMKVGEWVVAIGSPFGLEKTVTAGIISAKGRVIGFGPYEDFIQTDASINPGNSGGPLINLRGEVIGINTAIIARAQGLGFAIPINMAKKIIGELKENGEVTRGWLGVVVQEIPPEMVDYYDIKGLKGIMLSEVMADHPAAKAGLKAGDIILEVNGTPIDTTRKLTALVADIPVGGIAEVKILRDGKEMTIKVTVGKRDESLLAGTSSSSGKNAPAVKDGAYGLSITTLTPELAQKNNIDDPTGVIITAVKPKSEAAKAKLKSGDVIKEVNRIKVNTVEEFDKAIADLKKDDKLQLFIWRVNEGFQVVEIKR